MAFFGPVCQRCVNHIKICQNCGDVVQNVLFYMNI